MKHSYTVFAPENLPRIYPGDSIEQIIMRHFLDNPLEEGDVVVIAHKIVSKAEGRVRDLAKVVPSEQANTYASKCGKDPRLVQVIMDESQDILWCSNSGMIICQHKLGFVCANAAVDGSNSFDTDVAVLLPKDPNGSARKIREELEAVFHVNLGVIICDTQGRAFRNGAIGMVVGSDGVLLNKSYIGLTDLNGRKLQSSGEALGDELAAAATIVMGQGDEGRPIAVIRGLDNALAPKQTSLIRPAEQDIFLQALMYMRDNSDEAIT